MSTDEELMKKIYMLETELAHIKKVIKRRADESDSDLFLGSKIPVSFGDSFTNSVFDVKCCWPTVTRDGNVSFKEYANE